MISSLSKLMGNSLKTVSNWKKEKRPIMALLYKYFSKNNIEEFLLTKKIEKFEKLDFIYNELVEKNEKLYKDSFTVNFNYLSLSQSHDIFIDFYFTFFIELKKIDNIMKEDFFDLLNSSIHSYLLNKYIRSSSIDDIEKRIDGLLKEYGDTYINYSKEELTNETLESLKLSNFNDLKNLQKHTTCFKCWNNDILLFLDYILMDNLSSFIDSDNEELIYHAIGLNVYLKLDDKLPSEKLNIISEIRKDFFEKNDTISLVNILIKIEKYKDCKKIDENKDDLFKYII